VTEFDPLAYWLKQRDCAETALIIAQKEIHRLLGQEALENVVDYTHALQIRQTEEIPFRQTPEDSA
jgi:hypothetical protein